MYTACSRWYDTTVNFSVIIGLPSRRMSRLLVTTAAIVASVAADGLPSVIAVATHAPPVDKYAAGELLRYLQLACPAQNFTLGLPTAAGSIIVGADAALSLGLPEKKLARLGNESFYAAFYAPPFAQSIVLSGGLRSTRGTLYAVYGMLTDVVGLRFLAHDETVVPAVCPSHIEPRELIRAPAFEYRDNNQNQPSTQAGWSASVAYNGREEDATHGGHVEYASPPGFVHTSYNLLAYPHAAGRTPPAAIYAAHPEWFWPRGPAGGESYGQLCWSNSSLVKFLTTQARRVLQAQPDATILSVSQNDNGQQCEDPTEQEVNAREGSPIGALLLAVNSIAEALEGEFPHVAFDTLAYQWTRPAPTSALTPRHNVIIRLCSIECDFAHPLTHPNNAPFYKDMVDWSKRSNRTYIWNCARPAPCCTLPLPPAHSTILREQGGVADSDAACFLPMTSHDLP